MIEVSTKPVALLVALVLLGTTGYSQIQDWPLKRTVDLSSGFGDFRPNRFHAGVDLRTGGRIGAEVYSPVDGYVWRVKMSYRGYGKGLYIKGTDDHLYVLAHLSQFNDVIRLAVLDHQFESQRYYADIYFPEDSIPVRKGELIAYSGKTGAGAPHLHFEKRSPGNVPINPLSHGFTLDDTTPPTFERIGFHLQDDRSLFPNGRRKMFLPVKKIAEGKYELDTVLHMNAPFGVLADCYDQKRPGGMRQAIHQLTLSIDGVPYFETVLDSLPFEIGPVVSLVFDPLEAANDEKRVRRMYHLHDMVNETRLTIDSQNGVVWANPTADSSLHLLKVDAADAHGNGSSLTISFRIIPDQPSEEMPEWFDSRPWLDFAITRRGVIVRFPGDKSGLIDEADIRLGESLRSVSTPTTSRILLMAAPDDLSFHYLDNDSMAGIDDRFSISTRADAMFWPILIAVETQEAPDSLKSLALFDIYKLTPEAFPVRKEFEVSIKLDPGAPTNPHTGLCWYDKIEEEWVWIDEDTANADLAAGPSLGGGLFAAIIDTTAPTITELNLKAGHKYYNRKPNVKFTLEDNLSGFEDDLSLDIRIDGEWLLPELDLEDGECVGTLRGPLDLGNHTLLISVVDRAGNHIEQQVDFDVIKRVN